MATKEEHLGRETAAFLEPRGSIGHGEATLLLRLSDVLAERDAAREEIKSLGDVISNLKSAQPAAVDLVAWIASQREFSLAAFGPGARTKGVIAHIRKELAEVEADPDGISEWIDVVILALDGAWRAGHEPREIADALCAKLEVNRLRSWPDWRTRREDEPIEHVKAAQPAAESAPVVGGVTEAMMDELCEAIEIPSKKARGLMLRIRAAIRATKRVDVEKVAEAIHQHFMRRSHGSIYESALHVLRAIGDEPAAEAPAPFSIPSTGGESVQWAEAPSPEPAAPEETPPGVRFAILGQHIVEHRGGYWPSVAHCIDPTTARMIVGKLNEAEKLRARVAELEEKLGTRDTDRIWRSLHNPYDAIERECAKQRARADAAEKRVADVGLERDRYAQDLAISEDKLRAAEAKLAALGENPIQRELVERHRHVSLFRRTVETLDSILAGRGPEVAS